MAIMKRVRNVWNAFSSLGIDRNPDFRQFGPQTVFGATSPAQSQLRFYSERSIISSIYTTLSIDVAQMDLKHVRVDEYNQYVDDIDSPLNDCLTIEPNIDQGPRAFRQDVALTLFDGGTAAIVPVETSVSPNTNASFEVYQLRIGEILAWHPKHVRVRLYNEKTGEREEIIIEKRLIAIVQNPLHSVMNEPNSTLQRLVRKLGLLDQVDEQSGSGKLDIIIQLPYVVKSESRRQQAERRRDDIEFQLRGSKYGIAYTDGTEKITQLNRPAENNLLKQVEYLTNLLYNQLGLTEDVMNGTADEAAMNNYYARTIEPIVGAIVEAMQRSFLGLSGIKANERIRYFRNPFRLVPVADLAEIADKFTRNEILTANEVRSLLGIRPSKDKKADQLRNSNMPQPQEEVTSEAGIGLKGNSQNGT